MGAKAREIEGYKLWYLGGIRARNGVGIVKFKEHKTQEGGELCIDKYCQIFANSQLACLD